MSGKTKVGQFIPRGEKFVDLSRFLVELGATKDVFEWYLNDRDQIRAKTPSSRFAISCPVRAVHLNTIGETHCGNAEVHTIGKALGMSMELIDRILTAADSGNEITPLLLQTLSL
jgi:hypothetical protein